MQARQDEDEGNAAARASLPPQRQITARIMRQWPQHLQTAANPSPRRAQDVHQLHCPQSAPTLAEDSALRRNMPQRNDKSEDALKRHRISFSPAGAVWGKMGQAWIPDWPDVARPPGPALRSLDLRVAVVAVRDNEVGQSLMTQGTVTDQHATCAREGE